MRMRTLAAILESSFIINGCSYEKNMGTANIMEGDLTLIQRTSFIDNFSGKNETNSKIILVNPFNEKIIYEGVIIRDDSVLYHTKLKSVTLKIN